LILNDVFGVFVVPILNDFLFSIASFISFLKVQDSASQIFLFATCSFIAFVFVRLQI